VLSRETRPPDVAGLSLFRTLANSGSGKIYVVALGTALGFYTNWDIIVRAQAQAQAKTFRYNPRSPKVDTYKSFDDALSLRLLSSLERRLGQKRRWCGRPLLGVRCRL